MSPGTYATRSLQGLASHALRPPSGNRESLALVCIRQLETQARTTFQTSPSRTSVSSPTSPESESRALCMPSASSHDQACDLHEPCWRRSSHPTSKCASLPALSYPSSERTQTRAVRRRHRLGRDG